MTDAVLCSNDLALTTTRFGRAKARLARSLSRAVSAYRTRRALDAVPENLLRDVGLSRSDIPYVADRIAAGEADATRDRLHHLNQAVRQKCRNAACLGTQCRTERSVTPSQMGRVARLTILAAMVISSALMSVPAFAQNAQVKRGEYLLAFAGCNDCHTPGYFFGKPDMKRYLGGSEVGFEIPGLGVFHGPNLTPDPETGLGKWSSQEIINAFTKGKRPDGRMLAPIMPWHAFANLTEEDKRAVAAFLKSLPPVKNKVPGPFGPNEQPTSFVMKIVPPAGTSGGPESKP
jgi:uncharacterized protein YjiS (DUF1127 family)/cytochrome c553